MIPGPVLEPEARRGGRIWVAGPLPSARSAGLSRQERRCPGRLKRGTGHRRATAPIAAVNSAAGSATAR
jgi:hypothetical protein